MPWETQKGAREAARRPATNIEKLQSHSISDEGGTKNELRELPTNPGVEADTDHTHTQTQVACMLVYRREGEGMHREGQMHNAESRECLHAVRMRQQLNLH